MKTRFLPGILVVAVLLSLATTIACSRAADDAQITSEVQSKLSANSNLQGSEIQVLSNGGVVTLSGSVASDFERAAAANDAAQVQGVKTVVNNLQLSEAKTAQDSMTPAMEPEPPAAAPRRQAAAPAPRRAATPPAQASSRVREYNEPAPAPMASAPVPPPVRSVTVPEGSALSIRLIDPLDSEKNQTGDTFRGSLSSPVMVDGEVVIPANADVEGRVVEVKSAGRFAGQSVLTLELTRLMVNGKNYDLSTSQWTKQGTSRGKRTAATIGGGTALGAIIGGIAGGGKGAAIGAAVGAGAGTGVQGATKGQQIELPSETVLDFSLQSSMNVVPASTRSR